MTDINTSVAQVSGQFDVCAITGLNTRHKHQSISDVQQRCVLTT